MIGMFTITLILAEVLIWLSLKFWVKNKTLHRLLRGCALAALVLWSLHFGVRDFACFNIASILLILPITYAVYLISLLIVGTRFTKENLLPFSVFKLKGKLQKSLKQESLRNLYSATYEELLYRWFLQNALYELTHSTIISILLTIITFWAVHISKKKAIVQLIDIFVFSIVITLWFHFTINPLYAALIHIIRNQLVICQKYTVIREDYDRKRRYLKILQERKIQTNE